MRERVGVWLRALSSRGFCSFSTLRIRSGLGKDNLCGEPRKPAVLNLVLGASTGVSLPWGGSDNQRSFGIIGFFRAKMFYALAPVVAEVIEAQAIGLGIGYAGQQAF